MVHPRRRHLAGASALAAAALLAGCSGDINPVRDVVVGVGVGADRKKAQDFVERTRPAQVDYMPVGVSAPARPIAAKPIAGVKAAEAEMDALRAANEARAAEARQAGATPPPQPPPPPPPLPE
jgi:hypothetical protein